MTPCLRLWNRLWKGAKVIRSHFVADGYYFRRGSKSVLLCRIFLFFSCSAFLEAAAVICKSSLCDGRYYTARLGLSGRSFIPMLLGFGCTVPAHHRPGALENRRYRPENHCDHAVYVLQRQTAHFICCFADVFCGACNDRRIDHVCTDF